MARQLRYHKPSLTGMPRKVGTKVFREILSSPKPDRAKMHEESMRLEAEMIKAMENYKHGKKQGDTPHGTVLY